MKVRLAAALTSTPSDQKRATAEHHENAADQAEIKLESCLQTLMTIHSCTNYTQMA
jgi:hypothetical protein